MGLLAASDGEAFQRALEAEAGHATPKVDVRGALFDEESNRVLLVREARDGLWCLPGGWAEAMDTPTQACEREFVEEAGLVVRVSRLAAVHDGSRRNGHAGSPWHIYKLFFLVDRLDDDAPRCGLDGETIDVGFFDCDALPELSTARTTLDQLLILRDRHLDGTVGPDLD